MVSNKFLFFYGIIAIISILAQCQIIETTTDGCLCEYQNNEPICGSNGQTYSNFCDFYCYRETLTDDQKQTLVPVNSASCRNINS